MRRFLLAALLGSTALCAQPAPITAPAPALSPDEAMLQRIFAESLAHGTAYENLRVLTTAHPGRLAGSKSLEGAVVWGQKTLSALGVDRVFTQDVMVPPLGTRRPESVRLLPSSGPGTPLAALALGNSVATPAGGVTAEVIEVKSLAEVEALGREKIAGKIVFFNRPMDPAIVLPGRAYAVAGDQRGRGPITAAKFGAVAALTRSLTHAKDDFPHTGSTTYLPDGLNILLAPYPPSPPTASAPPWPPIPNSALRW